MTARPLDPAESVEAWRAWSRRFRPHRRRQWRVGDRFRINRFRVAPSGAIVRGIVFQISRLSPTTVWFYAPGFDDSDERARRMRRAEFRQRVQSRYFVRVEPDNEAMP